MNYLVYTGYFFYLIIFLIGLSLGSFLNAWVWRTRENFRIISGRSMCPNCRRQLRWYENIPVISFLVLGGKCHTCHNPIPIHFIFVEISTALIFLLAAWLHVRAPVFDSLHFIRDLTFLVILIMVFIYDFLYQEILSELVWFGALAALFFNLYLDRSLGYMLIGALAIGGFFFLQYVISKGRWIGGGDVRLGIMMGIWLGWPVVLVALIIAYVTGAIGSLFLLLFKRKTLSSATPFGTYLALGTLVCIFWGDQIVSWYVGLLR
ncbi:MAG: prepilin peptidase [Candidatus Magasanikbacteria bacterium]|nr:prepilin peptidase [Candidatus Magasanikbacteria bacterium]